MLLCNALEQHIESSAENAQGLGRTTFSIKEAVQVARSNNLMGLICSSKLLVTSLPPTQTGIVVGMTRLLTQHLQDLAPKLSESIKTAGLVLIADVTADSASESAARTQLGPPNDGLDGLLRGNGVLSFHESIDM